MTRHFVRTAATRTATAVGAAVIAAVVVAGSLSVAQATTEAVANNSITSAKIQNNTIRGVDIRTGAVASIDVADNSLTTADINDATINAGAVNGARIVLINHRSGDIAATPIVTLNGLTINVACTSGIETLTATVASGTDHEIAVISNSASSTDGVGTALRGNFDDAFSAGDIFQVGPDGAGSQDRMYDLIFTAQNGRNVTAHFITDDYVGGNLCVVSGYAVG